MIVQNNPVSRLVSVLEKASANPPASTLRQVWAKALGCEPKENAELLRLFGSLIALTGAAKAAVLDVEDINEQLYLSPFKAVENLLSNMNFDRRWSDVSGVLSPQTMIALKFAADLLKREGSAGVDLEDDKIKGLIETLDEVLQRVLDSELPANLKRLFMRNLEELRRSLLCIQISGPEGIEEEIERSLGSILRHSEQVKEAVRVNEDNVRTVSKVFEVIGELNDLVAFAQNTAMLTAPVIPLLTKLLP